MRRFFHIVAVLAVVASVIPLSLAPTAAGAAPVPQSREYTLNADFDEGTLVGVEHDTVADQLQLSTEQITFPFIWVANSGESTVSKIDTVTGVEKGRYRTGPGTEDPSRTTVDLNGDLWVGNRASNTATKIALYPTDLNNDGVITTSTGAGDVLPWGQDEAVLMRIPVDFGPRALAIDANNNVWIGGYGNTMRYYDGQTGAVLKTIPIARSCYGALIDSNGTLWISNLTYNSLTRIDDPSGSHTINYIGTGDGGYVYGIGIDAAGYIYTSSYNNNRLRKLDPATNSWVYRVTIPGGYLGRGVCVGLDGDVWVAQSGASSVTRHDAADGSLKTTITVGNMPTGVAVANDGKIWVTNYNSNSVMRIDPATNTVDKTLTGHTRPYNYSDMTGFIARNVTTRNGTWTVVNDSEVDGFIWDNVAWTSSEPSGTSVTVKIRSSNDGATWSGWQDVTNGATLAIADGRYLEIETTLKILTGNESPILYDLTVTGYPPNEPPVADAGEDQVIEQDRYGDVPVTLDGSGSTDDGKLMPLSYSWTLNDEEIATGVNPTVWLPLGEYTITLTVYDGEYYDSDDVYITVQDTTAPKVWCEQGTNPAGKVVPGKNRGKNGSMPNVNPDGFYRVMASDICTETEDIKIYIGLANYDPETGTFEPYWAPGWDPNNPDVPPSVVLKSGDQVKITEAPSAQPSCKKIGSPAQGGATAVTWHITVPNDKDLVVVAVDASGNVAVCQCLIVPPPPM